MSCSFPTAITHSDRSDRVREMFAIYTNIWRLSGDTQPRVLQNTSICELWRMCPRSQKTKSRLQRRHRRAAVPQIMNTDSRAKIVLETLWKREVVCVKIPFIQQKSREGCFVPGVQKDSSGLNIPWSMLDIWMNTKTGSVSLTHYELLAHGVRERNLSSGRGQRRSIL